MSKRTIDAQWVQTLAAHLQEVALSEEQARRLAELHTRFHETLRGTRARLAIEAEPADFARLLHQHADRFGDEGP